MGSWFNKDGLQLFFGPQKTTPAIAGDFSMPGETRRLELTIDLTKLTASAVIQDFNVFFPAGVFIEDVQTDTEVGATGGTSFSLGLIQQDQVTNVSDTQFLAAAVIADHTTAGQRKDYTGGVATAGVGVGTTNATAGYITAKAVGTYTAGTLKVRIQYRGIGTITQ